VAEYEATFGGLHPDSDLSYAVSHFFANGGGTCWVVRTAEAAAGDESSADARPGLPAVAPPTAGGVVGDRASGTGIYALDQVDLFNILCLPGVHDVAALAEAIAYAKQRRAMIILDLDPGVDSFNAALDWINDPDNAALKRNHAAAYFPRLHVADPLQEGTARSFPNCGAMAGLWARTDARRGVWKAPAGVEADLRGVVALDTVLNTAHLELLNTTGLNCLKMLPGHGPVSWGARTLAGADSRASQWKYLPVRRTALFIEESVDRGTRFAASEPNGEALWAAIRSRVTAFMVTLFRAGAFAGAQPKEAFFVKCGSDTTTEADIDRGAVNIEVGFAPLKPAEFVVLPVRQTAAGRRGT
jgi:phage tail sheath protein FI